MVDRDGGRPPLLEVFPPKKGENKMSSHLLGFVQELKAAGVKRITLELFGSSLNETTTGLFTLDELTT